MEAAPCLSPLFISSGTKLSLDAIKRRMIMPNRYSEEQVQDKKQPLLKADIVLAIPNVVMKVCI